MPSPTRARTPRRSPTALRSLLDDDAERARLAAAGITRAAAFTWDASAAAHAQAYELA